MGIPDPFAVVRETKYDVCSSCLCTACALIDKCPAYEGKKAKKGKLRRSATRALYEVDIPINRCRAVCTVPGKSKDKLDPLPTHVRLDAEGCRDDSHLDETGPDLCPYFVRDEPVESRPVPKLPTHSPLAQHSAVDFGWKP